MLAIDSLHVVIALAPLALYFLLLGLVNLLRRPTLVTGARDTAVLGLALSGLVAAGPMELFMPEAAAMRFHSYVWALLATFYLLCLSLVVLVMRPRLVVYNARVDQLRPVLAAVVDELDSEARWAGDSLVLPQLGVQLCLEQSELLRNAQLVAAGSRQSLAGWRRLEVALAAALRSTPGSRNPQGFVLMFASLAMAAAIAFSVSQDSQQMAQLLRVLFRE
ncbi:MAG: hypothetical protein U0939_03860 [Pirellulales bacterium]